jgi:hypothetical protein
MTGHADDGTLYREECLPVPAGTDIESDNFYCESLDCGQEPAFAFGIGGGWAYLCGEHYDDLPDKLAKEETND